MDDRHSANKSSDEVYKLIFIWEQTHDSSNVHNNCKFRYDSDLFITSVCIDIICLYNN